MGRKQLRIGVIGVGGRGALAGEAHRPEEGVWLVAGADVNVKALEQFQERYGAETFVTTDYRELLNRSDVDAVFVTSPDFLHEEHAVAALEAGKEVYLEKPMAITIEGCDRILQTAFQHRRKLYLGHNMRHLRSMQNMKKLIDDGAIGEVKAGWCRHFISYGGDAYFKDWHADRTKSMGLLLQKGAHDIDVLHWLCRGFTRRVTAMGGLTLYHQITDRHDPSERGDATFRMENWPPLSQKGLNPVIDVEDLSMMLMELDNGVFCSYQQCHFTPDAWRNYTIIGTEGRIENSGDMPGNSKVVLWNTRHEYDPEGDVVFRTQAEFGSHGGADTAIVAEFVRYLREGGKVATSPIAARYAIAAGYLATASLRCASKPLEIPPLVDGPLVEYFEADVIK
jgi:predicted dehydrogenase